MLIRFVCWLSIHCRYPYIAWVFGTPAFRVQAILEMPHLETRLRRWPEDLELLCASPFQSQVNLQMPCYQGALLWNLWRRPSGNHHTPWCSLMKIGVVVGAGCRGFIPSRGTWICKVGCAFLLGPFPHCQKASNIRTIKCRKRCAMNSQQNKIRYTLFGNICMSLKTIRVYKLYEFNA